MQISNTTEIPFLFIVGRPRSGTTLLRMLFDAHPNVVVPPECQFAVNLYGKYGKKNFWTEKDLDNFFVDIQKQWRIEMWNLDFPQLHKNLHGMDGNHSYGDICKVVYATYQSLFLKEKIQLFGDKNPGYSIYTKRLGRIFPGARFIYINRDYRDNYVSIKGVGFDLPIPSLPAQKWKYFYKKIHKDSLMRPESYCFIRYEDLVAQPEETMRKLCAFAGISYYAQSLNFHEQKENFTKTYPPGILQKYHSGILQKVNSGRVGMWKNELTNRQVMLLDQTLGPMAEQAGYERKYKAFMPLIALQVLPGRCLAAFIYLATIMVDKLPANVRMNILSKGPRAVAFFLLSIFNPAKLEEIKKRRSGSGN